MIKIYSIVDQTASLSHCAMRASLSSNLRFPGKKMRGAEFPAIENCDHLLLALV